MVRALRRRRKRYARRSFPIKAATEEHRLVCHLEQLTSGRTDAREHREPQANGLLSFDAREARYPRRRADGPRPCFHQGSHGSALSPRQSALHGLLDRLPPRVRSRVTDGADESLPPFQRTCRVPGRALARARTGAYHPATRVVSSSGPCPARRGVRYNVPTRFSPGAKSIVTSISDDIAILFWGDANARAPAAPRSHGGTGLVATGSATRAKSLEQAQRSKHRC